MDREAMRRLVHEELEKFTGERFDRLEDAANLREEAGLDSIDLVSLIVGVQGRLNVQLSGPELESMTRFGDLLDLLQAKVPARPAA
jgi:acyl carrier protein